MSATTAPAAGVKGTSTSTTKSTTMKSEPSTGSIVTIIFKFFALVDSIVELYLGNVIKPFLTLHEKFYTALNKTLRNVLDENSSKIPTWFTANFITYFRTVLVVPTLLLLACDCTWLPSFIVILVDFGDFLDGVVARFWVDINKQKEDELKKKKNDDNSKDDDDDNEPNSRDSLTPSPTQSDDDSFGAINLLFFVALLVGLLGVEEIPSNTVRYFSVLTNIIFSFLSLYCVLCHRNRNDRITSFDSILVGSTSEPYLWWIRRCCL